MDERVVGAGKEGGKMMNKDNFWKLSHPFVPFSGCHCSHFQLITIWMITPTDQELSLLIIFYRVVVVVVDSADGPPKNQQRHKKSGFLSTFILSYLLLAEIITVNEILLYRYLSCNRINEQKTTHTHTTWNITEMPTCMLKHTHIHASWEMFFPFHNGIVFIIALNLIVR